MFVFLCLVAAASALQSSEFLVDHFQHGAFQSQLKQSIFAEVQNGTDANEIYLRMVDASAKIPTGILMGNLYHLGDFDECYNIHSNNIYGKYCLGFIPLPEAIFSQVGSFNHWLVGDPEPRPEIRPNMAGGNGAISMGLFLAFCVPSSISVERLNQISSAVVANVTDNLTTIKFQENMCHSKDTEPSLSTGAILTITTLAVFLAISVFCTLYDVYLYCAEQKPAHEMLIAFSYLTNGQKLIKSNNNPDHLLCLNGIRAISMMWVILGHVYAGAMNAPVSNLLDVIRWEDDPANMILNGATVSVDTFFAVGGLVAAYTFLNAMAKGHKFNIFMYYLHRFLRLTPAYGIAILVHYNLLTYLGEGPLWHVAGASSEACQKTWWSSILYIANFVKDGFCIGQTWYLQVDMQLFLLSPLVLIPLIKWRRIAYIELGVLTAAGIIVPLCISYYEGILAPGVGTPGSMYQYYAATYARFGPYVIGIMFGVLLHNLKKSKPKPLNQWSISILWTVALGLLAACVFSGFEFKMFVRSPAGADPWANAVFMGFNRNGWALAVCLVVYLCVSGYGGPINYFLSVPTFQFLSKLSYSMFLVHFAIIANSFAGRRHNLRFSNSTLMFEFWGFFMLTLVVSVILCLTFESPVIILEKWIFGRAPKKSEKPVISNGKIDNNNHNNV